MKGAIFDFDGTLFDSMSIWDTAGEDYLRAIGRQPRDDLRQVLAALSLRQGACYLKEEYCLSLSIEEITDGINKTVEQFYFHTARPKPGVPEMLARQHRRGVRMCIATATDRYLIEAALGRCGLSQYFSEILTCTAVGHGKDSPMIYEAALAHLGTPKADTVIFEDAFHAIRTAKAAGFRVIAVYDPHEPNDTEVRALADDYLTDFKEIGL